MLSSALLASVLSACPSGYVANAEPATEKIRIWVPAALNVESGLEARLSIEITPKEAVPRQAMVLIKGLPASVSLSPGRLFESGVWAIKPGELAALKLAGKPGTFTKTVLTISLMTLEGASLGNVLMPLAVSMRLAPVAEGPPTTSATAALMNERSQFRIHTVRELEEILVLMQKGDENIREGKINAARLFYTYAAERGWAEGALALAATYDEIELSRQKIIGGVEANVELARQWYEMAQLMGAKTAVERLQRLSKYK